MVFTLLAMIWFGLSNKMKEAKYIPKLIKLFSVYGLTLIFCRPKIRKEIVRSYEKLENPRPKIITVAVAPEKVEMDKQENTSIDLIDAELNLLTAEKLETTILGLLNLFFAFIFICLFLMINIFLILVPALRSIDY